MIFVTVGTHEQQFNRLVKIADRISMDIDEEVIVQTGYSTYKPKNCKWSDFYKYDEINKYVEAARIVITHGGPSSFILPIQKGKVPIVVPRRYEFSEHVNNHQVDFAEQVSKKISIFVLNEYEDILDCIRNYDEYINRINTDMRFNNKLFNENFERLVEELFK